MNNQFTQRVSDIIMYSKEEANRLRNSYIGPEHLLLGLIREGEGKAIEILFNLQINLQDIKNQLEAIVKNNAENDTTYDENISFNEKASKVLKLCILEAKLLRNIAADSEHILLAIMKVKDNAAFHVLESNGVTYEKIKLTLQPDPHAGLGSVRTRMKTKIYVRVQVAINQMQHNSRHARHKKSRLMILLYSIISAQT